MCPSNMRLFDEKTMKIVKNRFQYVDIDPITKKRRLYFDNAGGALRLRAASDIFQEIDALPNCPEHSDYTSRHLMCVKERGDEDVRTLFNACSGVICYSLTASMAMFNVVRAILENIPGTNIVTTALEHPSSYDSITGYAKKLNKEIRIAQADRKTGGVSVESITALIDENTCALSVMFASNMTGVINDIKAIIETSRKIKPDLFILCDAVQHAPHSCIDIEQIPVDFLNIAPYKFFGIRGLGVTYLSDRAAILPHDKLIGKPETEWMTGSPVPGHLAAFSKVIDYLCFLGKQYLKSESRRKLLKEGMQRIAEHERGLMYAMLNGTVQNPGLREIPGVTVYFDNDDFENRNLILAIGFDDFDHSEAVKRYEEQGVIVNERLASSIYSKLSLKSLGLKGMIRVSPLHCHDLKDIDCFLKKTKMIATQK